MLKGGKIYGHKTKSSRAHNPKIIGSNPISETQLNYNYTLYRY